MSDWELTLKAARSDFIDRMEQRGFDANAEENRDVLRGEVAVAGSRWPVRVELGNAFPFHPPRVFPDDDVLRSWHRELDGAMRLYAEDDKDGLPWLNVDDFLRLVVRWLEQTDAGWPSGTADLDLDRYFPRASEQCLVVYGDLDPLINAYIRLAVKSRTIEVLGRAGVPPKQTRKNRLFGYVIDIGEPTTPPRTWEHIAELIPNKIARQVERAILDRPLRILLLRYTRRGRTAVLALNARPTHNGGIALHSYPSASNETETLMLRAGDELAALANQRVCDRSRSHRLFQL